MIAERGVTFATGDGEVLEGRIALPRAAHTGLVACHPHPLYGGDMDNPVVRAVADLAAAAGLAVLRFNFRSVGRSTGTHDGGRLEEGDVNAALAYLGTQLSPPAAVAVAGYSFGAAVAARVAARHHELCGVALIAPPLAVLPALAAPHAPVLVVAGDADDHCPRSALETLRTRWPAATIRVIDDTDHFFSGALPALTAVLGVWVKTLDAGQARRGGGAR